MKRIFSDNNTVPVCSLCHTDEKNFFIQKKNFKQVYVITITIEWVLGIVQYGMV